MPAPTVHGFAEKVALVVNGSEGVGRAIALQLALNGCFVIVSYEKTSVDAENALAEMKSLGTLANSVGSNDPKNIISEVDSLFGRLDLLVNCVKSEGDSTFQIEAMLNEALKLMENRPKPSIVNVIAENKEIYFADNLPPHFRQNCVITKVEKEVIKHELFSLNNFDDTARVVLFFLSSEAKSLNRQVLFVN